MKTNSTLTSTLRSSILRTALCLLTALAFFTACGNDDPDPNAEPTLSISPAPKDLAFSAQGGESYTFTVTTNQPIFLPYADQDWCVITADAKAGTFTVSALPNHAETAPEPATITVTAGKATPITFTATQAAAEYDLYISGHYADETQGNIACYWKNGVKTDLPKPAGMYQASSVAMDVDNGSVYIAGEVDNRGCYWKDGVHVALTAPEQTGGSMPNYVPISMAVDNGTVHVINREYYWKGGEQPRKYNAQGFEGYGIDASNGVYCFVGALHLPFGNIGSTAASQTNGASPSLGVPGEVKDIYATCVTLTDGTAYVGGHYFDKAANRVQVCYWNDGTCTPVKMPQGITKVAVRSICVENGKVYLAGHCSTGEGVDAKPYYWVDGECIALNLPGQTTEARVESMTVLNGNIYIAGSYKDAQSGRYHACYWVNGKQFDIPEAAGARDFSATGIALVKKVSN